MLFPILTFVFALVVALLAYLFGGALRQNTELWRTLPRQRHAGVLLGLIVLAWAAIHVLPMLEGGMARFRILVILAVPVISFLAYQHLDFLFARAFGGFLLLIASDLRHGAFVVELPARPLFAMLCYLIAIGGMVIVIAPWRFRDLLEHASRSAPYRQRIAGVLAVGAAAFAVFALVALRGLVVSG